MPSLYELANVGIILGTVAAIVLLCRLVLTWKQGKNRYEWGAFIVVVSSVAFLLGINSDSDLLIGIGATGLLAIVAYGMYSFSRLMETKPDSGSEHPPPERTKPPTAEIGQRESPAEPEVGRRETSTTTFTIREKLIGFGVLVLLGFIVTCVAGLAWGKGSEALVFAVVVAAMIAVTGAIVMTIEFVEMRFQLRWNAFKYMWFIIAAGFLVTNAIRCNRGERALTLNEYMHPGQQKKPFGSDKRFGFPSDTRSRSWDRPLGSPVLPATPDNPLGILSQQGFSARALATEAYWQRAVYQHYAGPPDPPIPAPADSLATNINNAVSQLRLEKARVEQLSTGNVDAELVGFVRKRMGSIERVAQLLEQMLGKLPREVRDRELTADELERLQEVNEDYLFSSASDNDEFKQQVQGVMNELDDVKPLRELHGRLIGRYVPRSFPWPLVEEESP
jgi:hypothetical protein